MPEYDIISGMESKVYLDAQEFLRDGWRLARQILDSGWRPDVLLALWRGGAPVGTAVHEFLKVKGVSLRHMPVKCASYTGIGQSQTEVVFSHADTVFAALEPGTKVLVVDDVFDTGRTAAAMRAGETSPPPARASPRSRPISRASAAASIFSIYDKPPIHIKQGCMIARKEIKSRA